MPTRFIELHGDKYCTGHAWSFPNRPEPALQEVALVVGLTLAVGVVAIAAATAAPARSVALQAVVLGAMLAALAVAARQLARGEDNKASIT